MRQLPSWPVYTYKVEFDGIFKMPNWPFFDRDEMNKAKAASTADLKDFKVTSYYLGKMPFIECGNDYRTKIAGRSVVQIQEDFLTYLGQQGRCEKIDMWLPIRRGNDMVELKYKMTFKGDFNVQ